MVCALLKRDEKVPSMLLLEDDEDEVKEEKGLKILTPNKLLTRFSGLLAQRKTRNELFKLKYEIRKLVYLL